MPEQLRTALPTVGSWAINASKVALKVARARNRLAQTSCGGGCANAGVADLDETRGDSTAAITIARAATAWANWVRRRGCWFRRSVSGLTWISGSAKRPKPFTRPALYPLNYGGRTVAGAGQNPLASRHAIDARAAGAAE
jgi:hypothetical protein